MIFPNDDFETTTSTSVPTFFKNETKIESINDTLPVHNNQKIYEESKNHQEDNIQAWITLSQVKLLFKVVKFCCVAEVSTFSIIITSLRLSFFRLNTVLTFNRWNSHWGKNQLFIQKLLRIWCLKNVNFVKNETLKLWILRKMRLWNCEFCEQW